MENISSKRIAILLFSLLSIGLLITRIILTGEFTFAFLTWNLFLAYIPMGLSTLLYLKSDGIEKWQFWPVAAVWLLFFPNAPYILTDLFHLEPRPGISEWFDLLLILSFAITGVLFGLLSLRNMHRVVIQIHSKITGFLFAGGSIVLGSFGVYLGRYDRYNSWDVFRTPDEIFFHNSPTYASSHTSSQHMGINDRFKFAFSLIIYTNGRSKCPKRDSNSQVFLQRLLRPQRLPISPSGHKPYV
jgi:uncharacterized membrane protein